MDYSPTRKRAKLAETPEIGFQFGRCRIFASDRVAFIDDQALQLNELAFEFLLQLAEARGASVTRANLAHRSSMSEPVEDGLVWVTVGELRAAFGIHHGLISALSDGSYCLSEEVVPIRTDSLPKSFKTNMQNDVQAIAARRAPAISVQERLADAVRKSDARYSISIIDDDEGVSSSIQSLLASVGLHAKAYPSIRQYSRTSRSVLPIGCVILDLRLPGEDGFSLFTEMANTSDALPVVFLTGHGDVPTSVKAMKHGAADFLIKPVSADELLQAVRGALENPVRRHNYSSHILSIAPEADSAGRGRLAPWQERIAKDMLLKDLTENPSLASIADACGISRSHFGHAFKNSVGQSPYRWLSIQRVQNAKELLLSGKPAAEVALLCGFSDQSHFNRRFSDIAGCPPGVWLRRNTL